MTPPHSPTAKRPPEELTRAPAQFFVPASASLHERRPRTLKAGDTFAVFDHNGDVISGHGSPEGIFHCDTRHLSHLYLTINDARPILLSSALREDNATLTCDLTNPDLESDDGEGGLEHDLLHMRRTRFLWKGASYERVAVRNFDDVAHKLRIAIAFDADFADLFEVRGASRPHKGRLEEPEVTRDRVTLSYTGLDDVVRSTILRFEPEPLQLTAERAIFEVELKPDETFACFIVIACNMRSVPEGQLGPEFLKALRNSRSALKRAASRATAVSSSNQFFNESVRRCVSDTYMLVTETKYGPYPYAGIPWFSTVFGRDGIITALELLWLDPQIAKGVLRYLAANQADSLDPEADAEPGKILHEVRHGEMAELGEVPFRRYYGSIDSTPLFVLLAGAYFDRTGDAATIRSLWPQIRAALRWIDDYGDRDGDGFVEYGRRNEQGLVNQGWKDSYDSIFHRDGALAKGPIALAEVQAYVYGAWMAALKLASKIGTQDLPADLEQRAQDLRKRFDEAFFDEELKTYVIALDGKKRPCRIRSSNAGHVLLTGLAFPERAKAVVQTLMSRRSFSGWGVRTVAMTEPRYNPISYHNGSVWPHDNALIASGFARYGYRREAAQIFRGLQAASTYVDLRRLPELFCGFSKSAAQGPTFYPVACIPQAWAAAAPLCLLQSCLGLHFDVERNRIVFDEPILPDFLNEVVLRNLTVGKGSADVALKRSDDKVLVDVLRREGDIKLTVWA